jgi:hypothetical protein
MTRLRKAWSALVPEQRLAAVCAAALFATMFLPWYSHSGFNTKTGQPISDTLSAWGAFSFVEAAVLLVAASVLVLLFARAEGRAFHLPGGDGTVILVAGGWAALLTFYRTLDKPNAGAGTIVGVEWGIFVAMLAALALAVAGNRIRAAHLAEPQLPGEPPRGARGRRSRRPRPDRPRPSATPMPPQPPAPRRRDDDDDDTAATRVAPPDPPARHARPHIDGGEQLSFDEQE